MIELLLLAPLPVSSWWLMNILATSDCSIYTPIHLPVFWNIYKWSEGFSAGRSMWEAKRLSRQGREGNIIMTESHSEPLSNVPHCECAVLTLFFIPALADVLLCHLPPPFPFVCPSTCILQPPSSSSLSFPRHPPSHYCPTTLFCPFPILSTSPSPSPLPSPTPQGVLGAKWVGHWGWEEQKALKLRYNLVLAAKGDRGLFPFLPETLLLMFYMWFSAALHLHEVLHYTHTHAHRHTYWYICFKVWLDS